MVLVYSGVILDGLRVLHFPIAGSVQMQNIYEQEAKLRRLQLEHEKSVACMWLEDELEILSSEDPGDGEQWGVSKAVRAIVAEGRQHQLILDEITDLYRLSRLDSQVRRGEE